MIMVLCLYVYAVTEYKLRKSLKETNETVPSQTGKPTQKPTIAGFSFYFEELENSHFGLKAESSPKFSIWIKRFGKLFDCLGRIMKNIISHNKLRNWVYMKQVYYESFFAIRLSGNVTD
jgi:hypothetical protein